MLIYGPSSLQKLHPSIEGIDRVNNLEEMEAALPPVMTRPFNLAGGPATSVNCGLNPQELPIGLQTGCRPFAQETVLKVAHAYEQATDCYNQRSTKT